MDTETATVGSGPLRFAVAGTRYVEEFGNGEDSCPYSHEMLLCESAAGHRRATYRELPEVYWGHSVSEFGFSSVDHRLLTFTGISRGRWECQITVWDPASPRSVRPRKVDVPRSVVSGEWLDLSEDCKAYHVAAGIEGGRAVFVFDDDGRGEGRGVPRVWLYDVGRDQWVTGPGFGVPEHVENLGLCALMSSGRECVYAFGGANRTTRMWDERCPDLTQRGAMPTPAAQVMSAGCAANGGLLAFMEAGAAGPHSCQWYDPRADRWQDMPQLAFPVARRSHAAIPFGGSCVHAVGGIEGASRSLEVHVARVDRIDLTASSPSWKTVALLPHPLFGVKAVSLA